MRRAQLGRRSRIEDTAADPLEGLVNLFDIGIVLAVAFLIAGLSLTLDHVAQRSTQQGSTVRGLAVTPAPTRTQAPQTGLAAPAAQGAGSTGAGSNTLPAPASTKPGSGHGHPLGTLYRLSDGRLLLVPSRSR
ncbi:MAG TPA: DUF2149 domain-containing protein [Solirubrobacteraceae bacterium]|nr:DUF2149 domain-containing protein [Solirubrobacteraceae bacterium]